MRRRKRGAGWLENVPFGGELLADWRQFGWQGLLLEVPESWSLSAVHGDKSSGYLRMDDGELVRLEVRWEGEKGKPNLEGVVKKYLNGLEKAAKKAKAKFWSKRDMRVGKLGEREHEYFQWREALQGFGLIVRCEECKKVCFARVMGRRGEAMEQVARRVFSSLEDHQEGEEEVWKFYDFEFRVPKDFKMARSSLRAGLFQISFSRGTEELEFARLGIADYVLKGKKPSAWYLSFAAKQLRGFSMDEAKEGPEMRGHKTELIEGWTKILRKVASVFTKKEKVQCLVWKCEAADKLLAVRAVTPAGGEEICEKAARSVVCHGEG